MEWLLWLLIAFAFSVVFGGQKKPPSQQRRPSPPYTERHPGHRPDPKRRSEDQSGRKHEPAASKRDETGAAETRGRVPEPPELPRPDEELQLPLPWEDVPVRVEWPKYSWEIEDEEEVEAKERRRPEPIYTQEQTTEPVAEDTPESVEPLSAPRERRVERKEGPLQTDRKVAATGPIGAVSLPSDRDGWRAAFVASVIFGPPRSMRPWVRDDTRPRL